MARKRKSSTGKIFTIPKNKSKSFSVPKSKGGLLSKSWKRDLAKMWKPSRSKKTKKYSFI